ncbi:MAG: ABC transporter permease [Deltaproteobacteria bacterium]|jgi:putative ABC transport system permease protein|nr:ABC transporter permease [Deltaproteobacteria bacterium]
MIGSRSNRGFLMRMLLSSLLRRRSRLLVALVGIAIGATVLLGLVALCHDIPKQLSQEFRSYGANMVFVRAGGVGRLSMGQLEAVRAALPRTGLVGLTPFRYESVRSHMVPYTAVGTSFEDVRKTSPYWKVEGGWPTDEEGILIGEDVAMATGLAPGSPMALDGRNSEQTRYDKEMRVAGVVSTGGVEDGFIFMGLKAMEDMTGEAGVLDLAEASLMGADEGGGLAAISGNVRKAAPGVDARIVTRVSQSEDRVLSKLTSLLYLVTFVVLSLTMICVATTMMTVVLERRREIGLKKALGAENSRVAREFLAEGLLLGVIGGLLGSILGLLFARLVSESVFGRPMAPGLHLIPITILASAIVAVVACLLPVSRAVDVEPAVVLKGE